MEILFVFTDGALWDEGWKTGREVMSGIIKES
jgi:hypothetical protein